MKYVIHFCIKDLQCKHIHLPDSGKIAQKTQIQKILRGYIL